MGVPNAEDRAATLKTKFERELVETKFQLDKDVVRIMLCGDAGGLRTYIDRTLQLGCA